MSFEFQLLSSAPLMLFFMWHETNTSFVWKVISIQQIIRIEICRGQVPLSFRLLSCPRGIYLSSCSRHTPPATHSEHVCNSAIHFELYNICYSIIHLPVLLLTSHFSCNTQCISCAVYNGKKTWYSCHKNPKLVHLSPKINTTAFFKFKILCQKAASQVVTPCTVQCTAFGFTHGSEVTSSQQREIIFWLSLEGRSEGWEATLGSVGSISWIISRKKIR